MEILLLSEQTTQDWFLYSGSRVRMLKVIGYKCLEKLIAWNLRKFVSLFWTFGICAGKSCTENIGEIDP